MAAFFFTVTRSDDPGEDEINGELEPGELEGGLEMERKAASGRWMKRPVWHCEVFLLMFCLVQKDDRLLLQYEIYVMFDH